MPLSNEYQMKLQLKTHISEGKTRDVVEILRRQTANFQDKEALNEVIQTAARFEDFERTRRLNHFSHEEAQRTLSQINFTLIQIIDRLPDDAALWEQVSPPQYGTHKPIGNKRKYNSTLIFGLIGLFALAFIVWRNGQTKPQTFSQTILVQDKNGDPILDNQGKVILRSP